ncbi:MAG: hypothetical protein ABFS46_10615 [Myxococcota bacterium]
MPEISGGPRRTLRSEFERLEPGLRVLAEDFLGLETTLDLVACDARGRLVLALVVDPSRELEGIASAIAQAEFWAPRVRDWRKLAPDLPLEPEGGVRVFVLARDFPAAAVLAAKALGSDLVSLVRCFPGEEPGALRLQPLEAPPRPRTPPHPSRSGFRFGLTDADLGLTPEERIEFA